MCTATETKEKRITEKQVGDTLYIIESVFSQDAKQTPYDKIKRLILSEVENSPHTPAA